MIKYIVYVPWKMFSNIQAPSFSPIYQLNEIKNLELDRRLNIRIQVVIMAPEDSEN